MLTIDIISHRQMDWNVEDIDEQLFDGGYEEYTGTLLDTTGASILRELQLDRWKKNTRESFEI